MALLLQILQPAIFPPSFASTSLPLNGPFALLIRVIRVFYSLLVLPLALLSVILPSWLTGMHHSSWNFGQTLLLRLSSQVLWAIGYGIPPAFVNRGRTAVPARPRSVYANPAEISACSVTIPPSQSRLRKGVLTDDLYTTATQVNCFWTCAGPCTEDRLQRVADAGEKVVMYFVGGGYLTGEPLKFPLPWMLAEKTRLRIFSVNYRKADNDSSNAFPAALHDVLSGWSHLLDLGFRPDDIFFAGDSAGAGLAVTLTLYLALCSLPISAGLVLYSPWLDLTLSNPAVRDNKRRDQLTSDLLVNGARVYTQNFPLSKAGPAMLDPYSVNDPDYLLSTRSFQKLGARHPLLSPALITERSPLVSALARTRFLISYGSVERLAGEIEAFIALLKNGNVDVVTDIEEGGWHNSTADALGGKQTAVERAMEKVARFVGVTPDESPV